MSDDAARPLSEKEIIARLLGNLGSPREVQQYLKQYASVDASRFAVVSVGGAVVRDRLPELASALTFLQRVGLVPVVTHGAGPQLDAALAAAGLEASRAGGHRVVTPAVLAEARRAVQRTNLALCDALERLGTRARPILSGVFTARAEDPGRLGFSGLVERVSLDAVRAAVRAGHLPVVGGLGETEAGQILYLEVERAARALALAVRPTKLIFLTREGGLPDGQGGVLPAVNLAEDWEELRRAPFLAGEPTARLAAIKAILDALPEESSVSITAPSRLARELFTHRGSGTLVRRGERILCHRSFDAVDRAALRSLLEGCFHKRLAADYFERKRCDRVYVSASLRATAIVTEEAGLPYLDKFAVTEEAQGVGLGASIWRRLRRDLPRLFWRARPDNPIAPWYFREADGTRRAGGWVVFWYGIDEEAAVRRCIARAASLPPTLT